MSDQPATPEATILPEDNLDPEDISTWRRDLVGFREAVAGSKTGTLMVFRCACKCGGHLTIPLGAYRGIIAGRARHHAAAKADKRAPMWGHGFYIEGHHPEGLAAQKYRTGQRTTLRATA